MIATGAQLYFLGLVGQKPPQLTLRLDLPRLYTNTPTKVIKK